MKKIVLVLFLLAVPAVVAQAPNEPLHISLVQLIANPEKFDGKLVAVAGFLRLEMEGDALYLSRDDFLNGVTKNAIWIDLTPELVKSRQQLNNRYVLLMGTFDASGHGHLGLFSGRMMNVSRAAVRPTRTENER
jgi:hypothetical protein